MEASDMDKVHLDNMLRGFINNLIAGGWSLCNMPAQNGQQHELSLYYEKSGSYKDSSLQITVRNLNTVKICFRRPNEIFVEAEFSSDNYILLERMVLSCVAGGVK